MNKRTISVMVAAVMTISTVVLGGSGKVFAAYDGTSINSDLNATATPDHITLTWSEDPTTTQNVTWRTNKAVDKNVIQYMSLNAEDGYVMQTADATKEVFTTAPTDDHQGSMNVFSVELKGLNPGTKYIYRVGNGENWSAFRTFTTEASNTSNFKFLVFGDSQSGNAAVPNYAPWNKNLHAAYNANKDAKFMINMGDLVEKGQDYIHWNNWFDAASGVIDTIPDMVVQGNHETYDAADWNSTKPQYFVNQFKVPQNGPDGYKGQTYSYNYGNAHFVVLDSQEDEEAPNDNSFLQKQADWLDKDLSASTAKWNFVFFHKTPYYNKASRANVTLKNIFDPIIEKHHVDVVFNGHDHGVSRTYAMNDGKYYSDYSKGTVYYVTGRSGAKYYPDLSSKVWDAFFYDPNDMPCYESVQLNGDKLDIKATKEDGTVVDDFVIDKDNPANSTKVTLPTAYNVDSTNPEVNAIGTDARLVVYGTPIAFGSNQAEVISGKAYINLKYVAAYLDGTYDSKAHTLTIGKDVYTFTADQLSKSGNVSIDALNEKGFNCEYNTQFNMVMIDK
ncbi:purple acid phosphatase family protein [Clostridium hydrogenum]|uniref:purple acid phosphatase family protein n=1 Tax=Clostridium hydrogenum TaxID=2855764 RepID=UPI001F23BA23|nr:metallophosphoesterase family protein [Clostridium hydrogenum]